MNYDDDPRGELPEGEQSSSKEIELLKSQIQDMQLEIDILKETLDVLKKDPGADMTALRNREKAVIIGALKNKYPLPILLQKRNLSRSSYRISEKIVRRIMAECGLKVKFKRKIKYHSYKGEITPAVPNIIARNFHADAPNQKWLTDITELSFLLGKYIFPLSWTALMACFPHGRSAPHQMQC